LFLSFIRELFFQLYPVDPESFQSYQKLEGFRINRVKLEEKFPDKGQEQMQQWR
jgi:hypothetical protein